jgi:hypothetical protein
MSYVSHYDNDASRRALAAASLVGINPVVEGDAIDKSMEGDDERIWCDEILVLYFFRLVSLFGFIERVFGLGGFGHACVYFSGNHNIFELLIGFQSNGTNSLIFPVILDCYLIFFLLIPSFFCISFFSVFPSLSPPLTLRRVWYGGARQSRGLARHRVVRLRETQGAAE